jgi:hypothetical protein
MASSSRLKPGEKGKITATIDIKGRKGLIHKNVDISSNDPQRPQTSLSLKANIQ